ncbi:MAG TPA: gliding-motility protein MglA [Firmicutes bacterium]|uniref:Gliding-motility protein MglA n=1 Tax=candidate division TA06 bacterium TaxID=2250710 RepID=A0A660SAX3_UNCT6|nr:MAG: gliding-motility protein MglA [candidate division TA06 bacterium]HFD05117.1 gliding-motility protein MglA [Bacillota bacterium]
MALINYAKREIICKIVYYGPGRSGKTTNLQYIYSRLPEERKTNMISLATEMDRTLFFDFLPLDLGKIGQYTIKYQLYTVPGQVYYDSTRKLVLQGADGVVFVADSQQSRFEDNIENMDNMNENLKKNDLSLDEIPIVLQFNKRDVVDLTPIEDLSKALNLRGWDQIEAIAISGIGVIETLKLISNKVLSSIKGKYSKKVR